MSTKRVPWFRANMAAEEAAGGVKAAVVDGAKAAVDGAEGSAG